MKLFKMSLPSEASDYIRKIGEHFIAFIHKLDQSGTIEENWDIVPYHKYIDSSIASISSYWISKIATYLTNALSQKYLRINQITNEGQLIVDLLYIRKLLS